MLSDKKTSDQEWLTERSLSDPLTPIAPGERTGILGVNGAGKSTLLGLIDGSVLPTSGRVKHGKTVRVRALSQRLDELAEVWHEPVRVVVGRLRASYAFGAGSKAQELTPGQLLERLGFVDRTFIIGPFDTQREPGAVQNQSPRTYCASLESLRYNVVDEGQ